MEKKRSYWGALLLALALMAALPLTSFAYTATEWAPNPALIPGTVVALGDNDQLVAASQSTKGIAGVVTKQGSGVTEVADTGVVSVLVSNKNGAIAAAQQIGLSDIAGVGTKWNKSQPLIGTAVAGLEASSPEWHNVTYKLSDGTIHTVDVAAISVRLSSDNGAASTTGDGWTSSFIQRAAEGLVGHSLPVWRVIAALAIATCTIVLAFSMLFGSSRETFLSLGRNPMASTVILHGLWRVSGATVIMTLAGLVTAYIVLWVGV